ncbi:MAG: hypothetical protein IIW82_05050, partial [Clostridia bacterium]|nr:hypothetical protein [Clostridia bacterium]
SGPRGRWFKSSHSDHIKQDVSEGCVLFYIFRKIRYAPAAFLIVPKQREGPRENEEKTPR